MTNDRRLPWLAWSLSVAVSVIAVIGWGETYSWRFTNLSVYQVFPLFGLLAYSLMWGHYVAAAARSFLGAKKTVLKNYFEITSSIVLIAILLHPGLLLWQLWRDGFGLPPGSTKAYVGMALYGALALGVIAWVIFMSYELRRFFGQKPWWRFVQYASDAAMVMIFFHALRLGGVFQMDWFKGVWYFYGLTFLICLIYLHTRGKPAGNSQKQPDQA